MTQIVLSDDLTEISAEINSYKHVAGQALFEIGRRLKHVRDNDLVHGQWTPWLESIDIVPQTATRMIQAYEQFGNRTTSYDLPAGKIFEMLSLPESVDRQQFVEEAHEVPSTRETKTVDEMTVRELREVKKSLKEAENRASQAEQQLGSAQSTARHYETLWNQAKSQPPRIETKVVEKIPDDYESLREAAAVGQALNSENVKLQRALTDQRNAYEEKLSEQQKKDSRRRDLQKYLSEQLRAITMNHDSAVFNYMQGDKESHDIVMRYLNQYESIVKKQFAEWEQLTSIRAVN